LSPRYSVPVKMVAARPRRLAAALFVVILAASSTLGDPADGADGELNLEKADMQTLTQMLHWSLEHQDLDALHAKAEAIRASEARAGTAGAGDERLLPEGTGAPKISVVDAREVRAEAARRAHELTSAMDQLMPDRMQMMKDALDAALGADAQAVVDGLHALEELVEDIDNARDFMTYGGFAKLLALLEHTESEVQAATAWVLGTAAQNNDELQEHLCSLGVPARLIALIDVRPVATGTAGSAPGTSSASASTSPPPLVSEVHSKALFALSAVCRDSAVGGRALVAHNGMEALARALAQPAPRVVRKALTLLTDLARAAQDESQPELGASVAAAFAANGTLVCGAIGEQLRAGVANGDADTLEKALDAADALMATAPTTSAVACISHLEPHLDQLVAEADGKRAGAVADATMAAAQESASDRDAMGESVWRDLTRLAASLLQRARGEGAGE